MTAATLGWLAVSTLAFTVASTLLRTYVDTARVALVLVALALYTAGNLVMVRLMRDGGMAVAISVSAVLQLLLATAVGLWLFGERPGGTQVAGILLGVVAVTLILWPART